MDWILIHCTSCALAHTPAKILVEKSGVRWLDNFPWPEAGPDERRWDALSSRDSRGSSSTFLQLETRPNVQRVGLRGCPSYG